MQSARQHKVESGRWMLDVLGEAVRSEYLLAVAPEKARLGEARRCRRERLDAGDRAATFTAPVASTARVAQPGGAAPTDQSSSNATVRVYNVGGQLHVQISFPR